MLAQRIEAAKRAIRYSTLSKVTNIIRAVRLPEPTISSEHISTSLFPNDNIIEQVRQLPQPDTQVTNLADKNKEEIVAMSQQKPLRIVLSGGTLPEQRKKITEAAMVPDAQIEIYQGEEVERQEKQVVRNIVTEFLDNPNAGKIMNKFLRLLTPEMCREEHENYAVGQNPDITEVKKAHYFRNLAVAEEPILQDRVIEFARQTLQVDPEIKKKIDRAIGQLLCKNLDQEEMEIVDFVGYLSNLLRGGIRYGFVERPYEQGKHVPMKYAPREIAYQLFMEIRREAQRELELSTYHGRRMLLIMMSLPTLLLSTMQALAKRRERSLRSDSKPGMRLVASHGSSSKQSIVNDTLCHVWNVFGRENTDVPSSIMVSCMLSA